MKYYLLQKAIYRRDIGKHSLQTEEVFDIGSESTFGWLDILQKLPNYHGKLNNDAFPDFEPRIKFKLKEGAKLTDSLNYPSMNAKGLLISSKFKTLLQQFNLMEHMFYPAQIYVDNFQIEYFWFHQKENYFEWIDFEKTEVYFTDGENPPIKVKNYKEYLNNFHKKGGFDMFNITLNSEFPKLDFFYLSSVNYGSSFFISETLMQALKKEKITGIEIHEQDILNVEK